MIIVTAASYAERIWIPRLPDMRRIVTGMGRASGEVLARFLNGHPRPNIVVSTGFCGGLSSDIVAGRIIIGSEIDFEGEKIAVDPYIVNRACSSLVAANLPFRVGRIVTTATVIRSPRGKERLSRTGAIAVDMESGVLSRVARAAETPFLPLRVVLDARDRNLPFAGDRLDALRAIAHPISTLQLLSTLIIAGRAIGRAIVAIATEPVLRRGECVA